MYATFKYKKVILQNKNKVVLSILRLKVRISHPTYWKEGWGQKSESKCEKDEILLTMGGEKDCSLRSKAAGSSNLGEEMLFEKE